MFASGCGWYLCKFAPKITISSILTELDTYTFILPVGILYLWLYVKFNLYFTGWKVLLVAPNKKN